MYVAVVYRGVVIGTAELRPGPDPRPGAPHVGDLEPTAAYAAIRDVCRGPVRAVDPGPAEPSAAELELFLARLGEVAALELGLLGEGGRAVPTGGPVVVQDYSADGPAPGPAPIVVAAVLAAPDAPSR